LRDGLSRILFWQNHAAKRIAGPAPDRSETSLDTTILPAPPDFFVPFLFLRSYGEYLSSRSRLDPPLERRQAIEEALVPEGEQPFAVPGRCALCKSATGFSVQFANAWHHTSAGKLLPNWREYLHCERCGLCNRVRAAFHAFEQELAPAPDAAIYITEAITPAYRWLAQRYPGTVGSEFLGDEVRHEDLMALSFAEATLDFVLSFDVFEHVPDERAGFREVFRCLRPGGRFLFSAPFRFEQQSGEVRAVRAADGTIRHLLPPEYHGNPVRPDEGSLCYRYFGWDCLDLLAAAGFTDSAVLTYWSAELGYLGEPQYLVMARKPGEAAAG
jgi:hypothetical protein